MYKLGGLEFLSVFAEKRSLNTNINFRTFWRKALLLE